MRFAAWDLLLEQGAPAAPTRCWVGIAGSPSGPRRRATLGIRYSCSGDLYDDDCTEKDFHNHNPGLSFILFHYLLIINFSSLTPLVLTLAFSNLT